MSIYIFGAGSIGLNLANFLESRGLKVCLVSSNNLDCNAANPTIEKKRYGDFLGSNSSDEPICTILTTRIDMLDVKTKSKLFESLVDLLQKGSHVLNFSSVAVYGDSSSSRKEDDFPNPINSYGFRKLETEKELIDLAFPDLITNLRISNLFGLSSFEDFTNTAHATIRKGEILHIPKSVTYRDFIPVNRLFLFVEFWINSETKTGQILNFASGQSVSLRGWAGYIADTLKKPLNLRSDLNTDFSDSFIDNTLLSKIWTAHFVEPKLVLESYVVKGWID